jgi:glyoxylase-like metal-dependent hydrolase (beta-lactamase superfamily II)
VTALGEADLRGTRIHRHATGAGGALVNAYLVETGEGIVAVDGTLTVSDARALRARLESLGKPLLAVLVTHAHPDHYGGIVELVADDDVPVVATAGVDAVIRRDDALKEEILRPMFGEEWPRRRAFPDRTVSDGERIDLGGMTFTVLDLGPGESPHDSIWFLGDDRATVFLGDQVYDGKHAYLADGFFEDWLGHLERLHRELPSTRPSTSGMGGRSRRRSSTCSASTSSPSSTRSAAPTGRNPTRLERRSSSE